MKEVKLTNEEKVILLNYHFDGDKEATEKIFRYIKNIVTFEVKRQDWYGTEEDKEDLIQNINIILFRKITREFLHEVYNLNGFVKIVITRRVYDAVKRRKKENKIEAEIIKNIKILAEIEQFINNPQEITISDEEEKYIGIYLSNLDERTWRIFNDRFNNDLTLEEIAKKERISIARVSQILKELTKEILRIMNEL